MEFINCITTIFYDVIVKRTGAFLILRVFILYRLQRFMHSRILFLEASFPIEHLCLTIKFVDNIGKICFIKERLPIKGMHIGSAFTIIREIFIPYLEKIEFAFVYQPVNIGFGNLSEANSISLLFDFSIKPANIFVCRGIRKMKWELAPVFMLCNRLLEKINQPVAVCQIKILSFLVCFVSIGYLNIC